MEWISDEQISAALAGYNPWWQDPDSMRAKTKPFKRLIVERAFLMITHPEQRHYAILSGFRYVGKTTCLFQMIEMLRDKGVSAASILYLSFENPIVKYAGIDDICRVYMSMNPDAKGRRYFFFDDIHCRGRWDSWMRNLFSRWEDVRLTATTSATTNEFRVKANKNRPGNESRHTDSRDRPGNESRQEEVRDQPGEDRSGTKHWTILNVMPLSFYEYCRLNGIRLPDEYVDGNGIVRLPKDDEGHSMAAHYHVSHIQNLLINYLKRGGLPRFASLDKEDYEEARFGPDIMSQLIGNDILSFFNIRHPQLLEELMLYLACKPSTVFVARQAAKELGNISVTTLEQYIDILVNTNLIFCSQPLDIGRKGACKGHPRIYIADPAIRNALLMYKPDHDAHKNENEQELNLGVEVALFRQLSTYYAARRVKPEYHVNPVYDYDRKEKWLSIGNFLPPVRKSTTPEAEPEIESPTSSSDKAPILPIARVGYFRKLHEPGKTIDLVVDLPEGQYIYHVMFYKRQPFRRKNAIIRMTKRPDAKFLGATIVTRKPSEYQTVGDGSKVFYQKEPALKILYLFGQDEYEWRKEELMEEQLEHDTLTGFDGAE